MAEAKNNFLKAKMNQDLDDRLLPNGEYRTAQNILVGKSEEDSVGTLENIKGNALILSTDIPDGVYGPMYIIGYYMDSSTDRIYTFLTDWTGTGNAPADASCSIRFLNVNNTSQYVTLVSGSFLNFSTQNIIISVNVLESFLFFTDNFNQPRKINVDLAIEDSNHYYDENHISVAKYNPYQPISLLKEEVETVISVASTTVFDVPENSGIDVGMTVLATTATGTQTISPTEYVKVVDVVASATPNQTTITISNPPITAIAPGDILYFLASTMTDQSSISTWPGDPDFLEDKFVRFGYRFKFEDNEYSIYSPFTQIAFIPKQNGYFIDGDEVGAVTSTILDWFENGINNIELIVPLPDRANDVASSYKISSIDIIYKESDGLAVKVLDSIDITQVSSSSQTDNYYVYSYQSRKPIRTLPADQTTRVYDKVPVKAKTQEIISNRIVYGNFQTQHTPPSTIEYSVNIEKKIANPQYPNFIEYPNHTIKQNRNYQIGFVLSDKFGRQSDVILSPVSEFTIGTTNSKGSTIYSEYIKDDPTGSNIPDPTYMPEGVKDWFGNSIIVLVNSPISQPKSGLSPGLYAVQIGTGFDVKKSTTTTITDTSYTFTLSDAPNSNINIPTTGTCMRGDSIDYVKVINVSPTDNPAVPGTTYTVTTSGRVSEMYLADNSLGATTPDIKFAYEENTLGWYSYKIVVKQSEQDYYNVYLPSAMKGEPFWTGTTSSINPLNQNASYVVLLNDNINKVPRDLSEVGPQDNTFRSSVRLFGRVENTVSTAVNAGNRQFFPLRDDFTVNQIDNLQGSFDVGGIPTVGDLTVPINVVGNPYYAFFKSESNPFVAEFVTSQQPSEQFGIINLEYTSNGGGDPTQTYTKFDNLIVLETEPFVSALDIYWESTEVGLISDLNWDVAVGFDGPTTLNPTFNFDESMFSGTDLTQDFYPINNLGSPITNTTLGGFSVTSGRGDVTTSFTITQNPDGSYKITNAVDFTYLFDSDEKDVFIFDITFNEGGSGNSWSSQTLSFTGRLDNITPSFTVETPFPYYYYNDTFVAGQLIHNFGIQTDGSGNATSVNGGRALPTQDLKWTIESGNSQGYFNMNPASGAITLTAAGLNSGNNTYPLVIRLTDTTENAGTPNTGNLFFEQNISIIRGFPLSNSYDSSIANKDWVSQTENRTTQGTCQQSIYADYDYVCCYSSDTTIANNNLPNFNNTGDFLAAISCTPCGGGLPNQGCPPPPGFPGGFGYSRDAYRIGGTQAQGEFVFGIEEAKVTYYEGACGPPASGQATPASSNISLRVYHTTVENPTSSDWTRVADINGGGLANTNTNIETININPNAFIAMPNNGQGSSGNLSTYFAGNLPGKYAFAIKIEKLTVCFNGSANTVNTSFSTRFRDLHYINTDQTRQVSAFHKFTNNNAGFTNAGNVCSAVEQPVIPSVRGDNPFPEYVNEFYTDPQLINVYTPPVADRFYAFSNTVAPISPLPIDAIITAVPRLNAAGEKNTTIQAPYAEIIDGSPAFVASGGCTYPQRKYAAPRFRNWFP